MRSSAVLLLIAVSAPVLSQSPLAFDAVSVRAVPDTSGWVSPRATDPQRFRAQDSVLRVIQWAYGVRDFQILGSPEWLKRERFEIQATAESPSREAEMKQMVQGLLADRFRLRLHTETREIPVYALVVDKNGPKLTPARDSSLNEGRGNFLVGNGALGANGGTMAMFVMILTDNLDRPVLDKTNLTGHYDFSVAYDQTGPKFTFTGPDIFTPIHDIDSVAHPTEKLIVVFIRCEASAIKII